jgi:uncharacterized protein YqgQ
MSKVSIYEVKLYCCSGNSNKEYNIIINENAHTGHCSVDVEYGRRGTNLKSISKASGVSKNKARDIVYSLKQQKVNKGYYVTKEVTADPQSAIKLIKFRLERLFMNSTITQEHYSKLSSMLQSEDSETVTLVNSIIEQKLRGDLVTL